MKKLNEAWRNQKPLPAQMPNKNNSSVEENNSLPKTATTRRRLGRFALVARPAPVVKKTGPINDNSQAVAATDDGCFPLSFLSSGKFDNDLLAEMDKVEAAMKCDQSPTRNMLLSEMCANGYSTDKTDSCLPGQSSIKNATSFAETSSTNMCTGVGFKRKAVKLTFPNATKEGPSSVATTKHLDLRAGLREDKINSPTGSPVDKRSKLSSMTPLQKHKMSKNANPPTQKSNSSSFPTPEGRYYGRKCKESSTRVSGDIESDISFSPLLGTPNISSDSSDDENEISRQKSEQKSSGRNYVNNKRTTIPLNVVETPKRSSTRKRNSPKNLMSPDTKISKSTTNKSSPGPASLSRKNEIDGTVQNAVLKQQTISPTVQSKATSPKTIKKTQLKSNCNDSQKGQASNCLPSEMEPPSSRIAPCTTSSTATTSPSCNITTASVNTTVNVSLTEDKRLLKSWGLPEPVLAAYQRQGVTTMFEWQAECLLSPSVLGGGNLIYSAPTSAGKTLVAEILVLKRVLETRKKALIILPFVSVSREKMFSLQRLYQDAGIRVGGFMGSHSPAGGFSALDVAVCTIEKGNGLVNRMMEDGRIDDIGVVVVDELHMVGDSHRGYLLELMLTKLEFLSLRRGSDQRLQIIGMSATLPNLEVLARWLGASLYRTDFRPVPLSEHIKVDNKIYDSQLVPQGEVPARYISPDDTDHILALCLETVMSNHSVLVFCPTKNWCEKLCETIARKFYQITHSQPATSPEDTDSKESSTSHSSLLTLNKAGLRESLEQLRRCPVGVDPMLGRCVINGVAYHHAGLTFDERDIIEGAFREGNLRVLVATSTLSSGVNLPARRVIVRTPMFHGKVIDALTFKQMSGRAGRKGVDTEGESILICKPSEKMKGRSLLQSELPPVESCLYFDEESGLSRSLKRAILEVVVSGVTSSPEDVMSYIKCTLLSAAMDDSESGPCTASLIETCITFLQDNEFVSMQTVKKEDGTECKKFFPTQLGSAILASSLSPDEGLLVFAELQKARRSFVLETELHVIYLVTPVYTTDATSIDWYHFYTLWENLSPAERRVADLVGVKEGFIAQAIGGRINRKTEAQRKTLASHHRFYTALVLNTLVREVPLMEVAAKFNLNKGQLQSLQQSAATYTGMLTVFCQRLGWHNLELILSRFQPRLSLGVQHELVNLVRISALTASTARMLYNAGYHSVTDVARAEAVEVEELFKAAVPFQSDKKQEGETDWERKERQKAKCIWLTGRKGMTELDAAMEIIQEAKGIVQGDLGVKDIAWNSKECDTEAESSDDDEEESACGDSESKDDRTENINENNKENIQANVSYKTPNAKSTNDDERNYQVSNQEQNSATPSTGASHFTRIKSKLSERETSPSVEKGKLSLDNKKSEVTNISKESFTKSQRHFLQEKEKDVCQNESKNDKYMDAGHGQSSTSLIDGQNTQTKTNSGRVVRRKSWDKRRKSTADARRSKGSERSFFGQVVVTPPLGVRPKVDERRNRSSGICGDDSLEIIRGAEPAFGRNNKTQLGAVGYCCEKTQQSSQLLENELIEQKRNGTYSGVLKTMKNDMLNKSSCSKEEDSEKNGRHISFVGDNINQREKATGTKTLPTSNDLLPIESHTTKDSNEIPSTSRTCETVKNRLTERLEVMEQISEIICDEKNTSSVCDNLSFSESFILDTQTAALINAGCDEYATSGENVIKTNQAIEHGASRRKDLNTSETANIDIDSHPDQSTDSVSILDSSYTGLNSCIARPDGEQKNVLYETNNVPQLEDRFDTSNLSSSFLESPVNEKKNIGRGNDDGNDEDKDNGDDEPDSLLIASCYERVSNFDEGMLEASNSSCVDLGANDSLSELNVLRNTSETSKMHSCQVQGRKSKSNAIVQNDDENNLLPSASVYSYNKAFTRSTQLSDTQCTDDSFLAAVDLGGFTPLSSHCGKDFGKHVSKGAISSFLSKSSLEVGIQNTVVNNKSCDNVREHKDKKGFQCPNTNAKSHTSDQSETMFLSDSLSASLVDQAFAQCDLTNMKTSSPCIATNDNLLKQTKRQEEPFDRRSTRTTPTISKHLGAKSTRIQEDISPVLWDNPDSHANSPNTSSCHDGSDCVPPTPPDEASRHASPFKLAFMSPMASRKKTGGPSNTNNTQTKEQSLKHAAKESPLSSSRKLMKRNNKAVKSCFSENGMNGMGNDTNVSDNEVDRETDCLNDPLVNVGDDYEDIPRPAMGSNKGQITSQSQLLTQQSFTIIDVCAHRNLFQTFLDEWKSKPSFSLALACEKMPPVGKGKSPMGIGSRFSKRKSSHQSFTTGDIPAGLPILGAGVQLVGVAVAWEHRDAYYLSLMTDSHKEQERDPDDSLAEPSLCDSISWQDRIDAVINHLHSHPGCDPKTVQTYDTKTAYTTLAKTLGVSLEKCQDPRVADWLREPGGRLKNLHRMVTTYLDEELSLLEEVGGGSSYQSLGFDVKSRVSGRIRACTESILTRKLMGEYRHMLEEQELWHAFESTEMPALLTLSRMELNGFGLSMPEMESQKLLMKTKLESIEQVAYKMAGHVFSLTSLDDIAKILYLELKLPLNGDPDAKPHLPTRGTRNRRTVGGTSKEILEKLTKFHPLPALVLEWRRISSALTKSLFALQRSAQRCDRLDMVRVFGDCQVFSATGRVSMAEPNIQNIPKDFCVELKELNGESSTNNSDQQILSQSVSMRKMFVPFTGGVILSADYSQLELRIIAHLSGDARLGRILNAEGGDVFKLIAAQFKSLDVEEVSATDRQQAKQVCYGMLYGIGPKALGEQIGVGENEATVFMETFKSTYPGVRKYLRETVEFCQKNGFVKTLFNRRRYLPSIKHTNPHARAQAERQAVNTSVQGSAADLVKKAMTNIDVRLMERFPDCRVAHSHRRRDEPAARNETNNGTKIPKGGFFLLQLHDELIYEVSASHLDVVARLVKEEMEGACRLCVRMPVKVNTGPSWGQLEEYDFGHKR